MAKAPLGRQESTPVLWVHGRPDPRQRRPVAARHLRLDHRPASGFVGLPTTRSVRQSVRYGWPRGAGRPPLRASRLPSPHRPAFSSRPSSRTVRFPFAARGSVIGGAFVLLIGYRLRFGDARNRRERTPGPPSKRNGLSSPPRAHVTAGRTSCGQRNTVERCTKRQAKVRLAERTANLDQVAARVVEDGGGAGPISRGPWGKRTPRPRRRSYAARTSSTANRAGADPQAARVRGVLLRKSLVTALRLCFHASVKSENVPGSDVSPSVRQRAVRDLGDCVRVLGRGSSARRLSGELAQPPGRMAHTAIAHRLMGGGPGWPHSRPYRTVPERCERRRFRTVERSCRGERRGDRRGQTGCSSPPGPAALGSVHCCWRRRSQKHRTAACIRCSTRSPRTPRRQPCTSGSAGNCRPSRTVVEPGAEGGRSVLCGGNLTAMPRTPATPAAVLGASWRPRTANRTW